MRKIVLITLSVVFISCGAQPDHLNTGSTLFKFQKKVLPRWGSFENPSAEKGAGGTWNKGAKGHAYEPVAAGETKVLLDVQGSGLIQRMWMTLSEKDPEMLRALRLDIYWDAQQKPAVSVPFGDFFGDILGHSVPFENALFSDPEGRSFNCIIPMPFKKGARITVTNESDRYIRLFFYDINFVYTEFANDDLYFHAYWHREIENKLGVDFEILPRLKGKGRFLGSHIGVVTHPRYKKTWWGEGEVKVYLDGDTDLPTLNGTGAEDYPGSGWGLGAYTHQYQGCFLAESPEYTFYRYHIPDPIFFNADCRVTIQRMGGAMKRELIELRDEGAEIIPVTQGYTMEDGSLGLMLLQDMEPVPDIEDPSLPPGWMNFYRSDDYSATAFFYLDSPTSSLPALAKDR